VAYTPKITIHKKHLKNTIRASFKGKRARGDRSPLLVLDKLLPPF